MRPISRKPLYTLTLAKIKYPTFRSILAREFQYGTRPRAHSRMALLFSVLSVVSRLYPIPILLGVRESHPVRPRTFVLNLPMPLRHRFFFQSPSHSARDCPLPSPGHSSSGHSLVHILRCGAPRVGLDPSRRHPWHYAHRFCRRLLLQVRSIQNKIGLYKNV